MIHFMQLLKMESFMEEELQMIKALWCLHFLL